MGDKRSDVVLHDDGEQLAQLHFADLEEPGLVLAFAGSVQLDLSVLEFGPARRKTFGPQSAEPFCVDGIETEFVQYHIVHLFTCHEGEFVSLSIQRGSAATIKETAPFREPLLEKEGEAVNSSR